MDRRNFVATSAVAGLGLVGSAFADSHKHMHHGNKKHTYKDAMSDKNQKAIIESTEECLRTGQACLAHCTRELASGSTAMAACNATIQKVLASCEALNKIAHTNTLGQKALAAFAEGCKKICQECYD